MPTFVAPASADARRLILAADVVVGFQTTAMIEAAVAGKPVVYTGWDPEERRLADRLTPFDEIDPPITVVRDAAQKLVAADLFAAPSTPEQFSTQLRNDIRRWGQVVKDANITAD